MTHHLPRTYVYTPQFYYITAMELLYPQESRALMRIAMALHRELGCGFKEKVYQDAMEVLLQEHGIPYVREKRLQIIFHGHALQHDFYYDFLCYGKIGVEIKATETITGEHQSQLINYLRVGQQLLGVVFNFGNEHLQYKWLVNQHVLKNEK